LKSTALTAKSDLSPVEDMNTQCWRWTRDLTV